MLNHHIKKKWRCVIKLILFSLVIQTPLNALKIDSKEITLGIDTSSTIKISPKNDKGYTFDIVNPNIAIIQINKTKNELLIKGRTPGQTILMGIDSKGNSTAARVIVKDKAGKLPRYVFVTVSGTPCDQATIQKAINLNIELQSQINPNCTLSTTEPLWPKQLQQNEWAFADIQSTISGENFYSITQSVKVIIQNKPTIDETDNIVMISNNPEVIQSTGKIFESEIAQTESTRLIYHHGNLLTNPIIYVSINLTNENNETANVLVSAEGTSGPSVDSLFVGHTATKEYLSSLIQKKGYVLTIPPQKTIKLSIQKLPPGQYISGLIKIKPLNKPNIKLTITADPTESNKTLAPSLLPRDNVNSHLRGKFRLENMEFTATINNQIPQQSFDIGADPIEINDETKLIGNYGIIHKYFLEINNDSPNPKQLQIILNARGGFARGCFIINNKLMESKVLNPPQIREEQIDTIPLKANETKQLNILTLPQAGTYYPVKLIIKLTEEPK